jgi:hypothetical protein
MFIAADPLNCGAISNARNVYRFVFPASYVFRTLVGKPFSIPKVNIPHLLAPPVALHAWPCNLSPAGYENFDFETPYRLLGALKCLCRSTYRARGSLVVKALCYKPEDRGFQTR